MTKTRLDKELLCGWLERMYANYDQMKKESESDYSFRAGQTWALNKVLEFVADGKFDCAQKQEKTSQ